MATMDRAFKEVAHCEHIHERWRSQFDAASQFDTDRAAI